MPKSNTGNAAYFNAGIWYEEKTETIHMTRSDARDFHIKVHRDPSRKNGHPTLFKNLANCLRAVGASAPDA